MSRGRVGCGVWTHNCRMSREHGAAVTSRTELTLFTLPNMVMLMWMISNTGMYLFYSTVKHIKQPEPLRYAIP